jgi:hypothetical protein
VFDAVDIGKGRSDEDASHGADLHDWRNGGNLERNGAAAKVGQNVC